jgi:hypothetical protein
MRLCKYCRQLGRVTCVCGAVWLSAISIHHPHTVALLASADDQPHTHEDRQPGPPRWVRAVAVSTASARDTGPITVPDSTPGTWKKVIIRVIPPST